MSLISDLCRLCLANCRSLGNPVYPSDARREKIRECLSIIIEDDLRFPLIICNDCDSKLNCFYQFRADTVRAQHEFDEIVKSLQPVHYESNQVEYYQPEMESIRGIAENMYVNVDNIYASTPAPTTIQSTHDYDNQCSYIEHDLHLALDDDNQTDSQSLVSMSNADHHMYQTVLQPHISPLSPATTPPLVIPPPQITPHVMEPVSDNQCYQENQVPVDQYIDPSMTVPENDFFDAFPNEDNDSFTYDDFDESCQSGPSDRNNIDNAIDKKIEEFIQNKGTKAPKICTVCNKLFRTNYKLRVHMETHAENNAKFICTFEGCNKAFKSKIGLKEHAAKHTDEFNFTCDVCQKKFLLRSYFVAHQRIHSNPNQKILACSLCPKTFKSKQNLIDHENCHLGLKYFKCEVCEKSFTTKTHLDVHFKQHHTQPGGFACSICSKFFKTKNYLKVHIRTHSNKLKNYSCEQCGKNFIQLSDLKIHIRVHTNERNFVCETCGKAFSRKDSLDLHANTHNTQKPFKCENCGKSFSRRSTLKTHGKKCLAVGITTEDFMNVNEAGSSIKL